MQVVQAFAAVQVLQPFEQGAQFPEEIKKLSLQSVQVDELDVLLQVEQFDGQSWGEASTRRSAIKKAIDFIINYLIDYKWNLV